jgi:hypothetical protein
METSGHEIVNTLAVLAVIGLAVLWALNRPKAR